MAKKQSTSVYLTAPEVQNRYGVSHMFLVRRLQTDPDFPKPIYIGRLRFFMIKELDEYEKKAFVSTSSRPASPHTPAKTCATPGTFGPGIVQADPGLTATIPVATKTVTPAAYRALEFLANSNSIPFLRINRSSAPRFPAWGHPGPSRTSALPS